MAGTKFCKYCGETIPDDAVICTKCGRQVETPAQQMQMPNIVINNNTRVTGYRTRRVRKNKWVAVALCLFTGIFGGHKFYEGKTGMGVLYLCTAGLCMIGVIVDLITLLLKPNPYYV